MKTNALFTAVAVAVIGSVLGCSKEQPTSGTSYASTIQGTSKTIWLPSMPNKHHLIVAETSIGREKISNHLMVVDFGENVVPNDIPTAFRAVELVENGTLLRLLPIDGGQVWEFSTASVGATKDLIYPLRHVAIGISDLTNDGGWLLDVDKNIGKDAFSIVAESRLMVSDVVIDMKACPSGGVGSSGCTTSGGGTSCSVTCASGYYGCCGYQGVTCFCRRNGLPEPK